MHALTAMPGSRDSSKELVDVRELVRLSCACKLPMRTPHAAQGTLPYPHSAQAHAGPGREQTYITGRDETGSMRGWCHRAMCQGACEDVTEIIR